ncbi:MAG: flagellar hook-length control protein FliK [Arcobacteraceae bacterium]|nr:flagellar hook-length control protein FliK [Arcobacteraceae bacterium]MDY0364376.1 flagellar hook-length control protein FliK [Arcobacteraceae bacterium]
MILQNTTVLNQQSNQTQLINIINQKSNPMLDSMLQNSSNTSNSTNINQLNPLEFLKTIFQSIKDGDSSQNAILEMLKSNYNIKNGINFSENIKELITLLKQMQTSNSQNINTLLTHIKDIEPQILQNSLLNSGIFMESNLLKMALGDPRTQDITKDTKSILLQLKNELQTQLSKQAQIEQSSKNLQTNTTQNLLNQTEKLIAQIEYFQLLSIYGNGNYFYLPFYWEELVGGTIYTKYEKSKTYCELDLELQSYGNIKVMISLYGKESIDISFGVKNQEFKSKLQDNLKLLRIALNKAEFNLMGIQIIDYKEQIKNPYKQSSTTNSNNSLGLKV